MQTARLDNLLDAGVLPGFSRIGFAARRLEPVTTRMDGRIVVVTGATGGIGKAAATALAGLGAEVVLVARNPQKLDTVTAEIARSGGIAHGEAADLSLMGEVGALADRLGERFPHIDVLVNNVGVLHPERQLTVEGLEATFATNLLGQFILTNRLVPSLGAAPHGARIVTVSSGGMYTARLSAVDLQSTRSYKGSVVYARTKRAQVALAEMWAERLAPLDIVSHSMHPGWADTPGVSHSLPAFARITGPILRTPEQGADTIVWLAADPSAARTTGGFWHDRVIRPTHRLRSTAEPAGERDRLWAALESIARDLDVPAPGHTHR